MIYIDNRFIHSIKTAIAVLIGFAATEIIHFHVDQWLLISIIVVMCAQMNVGSILQKSYMRFLGTLLGSLIAALTLTLFGKNYWITASVVALSASVFSYIATSSKSYSDSGTLGAVTVAIILINPNASIISAAERFLEISAGILIAALVSQFIFPIHARRNLRDNQAHTLRLLKDYYLIAMLLKEEKPPKTNLESLDELLSKSLIAQRKLATEASHEPIKKSYNTKLFKQSLWDEREILRCIRFMNHAYHSSDAMKKIFLSSTAVRKFHEEVCYALEEIANSLEKSSRTKIALPTITNLKETIEASLKILPKQDTISANTFLFSAEILIKELDHLSMLVLEMNN